jgi:small subunit ribosomal protein S17
MSDDRGQRKVRTGVVASDAMDKTVVVEIIQTVRHDLYGKTYRRRRKLYAHDETNTAKAGDRVVVAETRPLSKLKHWRVVEILERAT